MKEYKHNHILLFCLLLMSCGTAGENIQTPTIDTHVTAFPITVIATPIPTQILSQLPNHIVLPSVTMSTQENEKALLELLKTNGNCTGKCIAGIQPDNMTVQDAIDKMAQWGMVRIGENSQGKTFINLIQNPLNGRVTVQLSIGTWIKEFETIDTISVRVGGSPGNLFLGEDLWLINRDAWRGYRLDSILKAYGVPSYVGYFFQTTVEVGTSLIGRTISYTMDVHYNQTNLVVITGELANYDGESLFLCPTKDPHDIAIEINPERPLIERQDVYPLTWQALTATDLNAFYETFTKDTDACIRTTLEQIQILQPSFR